MGIIDMDDWRDPPGSEATKIGWIAIGVLTVAIVLVEIFKK